LPSITPGLMMDLARMDPLTHTLLGATLARTRLGRAPLAGAACIIGANLPDVDVLAFVGGPDASYLCRRGWTHGIVGLPVLVLALVAGLHGFDVFVRRRSASAQRTTLAGLFLPAAAGILSHPLLDWLNTYGIRLLFPFDGRWFYGDALFIVDPWLWLGLGGALVIGRRPSRRGRLVWIGLALAASALVLLTPRAVPAGARVLWILGLAVVALWAGVRRASPSPRAVAGWALAGTALYCAALVGASAAAAERASDGLRARGVGATERLMVSPRPANPWLWDLVADAGAEYVTGRVSLLGGAGVVLDDSRIPELVDTPPIRAARAAPGIRGVLGWMRFPFAEIVETAEGFTVRFLDARYVRPGARGFATAEVRLDRDLRVLAAGPGSHRETAP
jgi:inner membrane protein